MNTYRGDVLRELRVDHVKLYVTDIDAKAAEWAEGYGFAITAMGTEPGVERSVAIGRENISLVLIEPLAEDHPGAVFLRQHGDGVADIGLRTPDAEAAFAEAVRRGARPVMEPRTYEGVVAASVEGFGDVLHTFIQRPDGSSRTPRLPGLDARRGPVSAPDTGLREIDHFAVCLEAGRLEPMVEFYQEVLDFRTTFTERIVIGEQAMNSIVVQSACGGVTFTLIEPDVRQKPGQIDEFLKENGGPGIQHIAFNTGDILRSVGLMRTSGIGFLHTPEAYYRSLSERLELLRYSAKELAELDILADEDHAGQLFQIFTKSTHPRRTLFFEVIERAGATTFGNGNIKALYLAVQADSAG